MYSLDIKLQTACNRPPVLLDFNLAIIRSTGFDIRNTALYPKGVLYTLLSTDVIWFGVSAHKTPGSYDSSAIRYFQFSIFAPLRHNCRPPARYQPRACRAAGPCATGNSVWSVCFYKGKMLTVWVVSPDQQTMFLICLIVADVQYKGMWWSRQLGFAGCKTGTMDKVQACV